MSEEGPRSKLWWVILAVIILTPLILFSGWGLGKFQNVVNDNAEKPWSADLQRRIADAYAYTMRDEQAAQAYRWAHELFVHHGNDDLAAWMLLNEARAFESAAKKYDAERVYAECKQRYPRHEAGALADAAIVRIHTVGRP